MAQPKIAVFAYNFPHKKSHDFLIRLFLEGIPTAAVIACDPVKLNIPASSIRVKARHLNGLHPRVVAERLGVPYHVMAHNNPEVAELVRSEGIQLGIVAGARILKKHVIEAFPLGIINYHPGLIPEARGLDAMLWSIYRGIPLGVTAHLIDERVDAGSILLKQEIGIKEDDTLFDFSERLYETQLEMIRPAVEAVIQQQAKPVSMSQPYNRKMPPEVEAEVLRKFPEYLRGFCHSAQKAGPTPR